VQAPDSSYIKIGALLRLKKICLFFLPFFLGYLYLQNVLNISEPLAVSVGRSMEPTIHEGDILVFKGVNVEDVEVGDVVLFMTPDEMLDLLPPRITHRVIGIRQEAGKTYFRTKGDNAPLDTYEIPADNIIGMNVAVIPYIGIPILFAQSPLGMASIAALMIVSLRRNV
jgi:signal peptidase I